MSRKIHLIDRFDGGLNESSSPRKISGTQIAKAIDVQYRKHGRIEPMGHSKKYITSNSNAGPIVGTIEPGYGLHHYNVGVSQAQSDSQISTVITTQGSDGSEAVGSFMYTSTSFSTTNQNANAALAPFTFTIAMSGGHALGSIQITNTGNDHLGMMGGTLDLDAWYTLLAAEINVTSSDIEAEYTTGSESGLIIRTLAAGTTYNTQGVTVTVTNDSGTDVDGTKEYYAYYVGSHNGLATSSLALSGGAAITTHVVTSTVDSVAASGTSTFVTQIGCLEGSTSSIQSVAEDVSGGVSTSTAATEIRAAINADGPIGVADNISSDGSTENTDFAAGSGANIVMTTDKAGADGVFSVNAYVSNVAINAIDDELLALMTDEGYFNIISSSTGSVSSGEYIGSTADQAALWSNASPLTQYYDIDGILRIHDALFTHTANNNKWLGHIFKEDLFNGFDGGNLDIVKWLLTDQDVTWAFTFDDSGHSSVDGKGIRQRAEENSPDSCAAKEMQIKLETTGSGTWGAGGAENYKFFASAVYDGDSETTPDHVFTFTSGGQETLSLNMQQLKVTIHCDPGAADLETNYVAGFRVDAFRIYWSTEKDGYGVKNLLGTIHFKDGFIREDGGSTCTWAQQDGSVVKIVDGANAYFIVDDPAEIRTFQQINLYDWQGNTLTAKYKSAVVAGRRAFIGHVLVDGITYNDRIIYSPVNQFDVFPHPDNVLQTTSSDGSSITALAATGDRLFEFKENILYIHNISSGEPTTFFIEARLPHMGCLGSNKIINVKGGGLFWFNEISAYYYDGDVDNIKDLRLYGDDEDKIERITRSTWSTFIQNDSFVGYDAKDHTAIIKQGAIGDSSSGYIYQYDFTADAWSASSDNKWVKTKDATNFVTMNDGTLINAFEGSYSATWGVIDEDGDQFI